MEHAWQWFALHAAQRIQVINFILVSLAFGIAGYGAAYAANNYLVAIAVAAAGAIILLFFLGLDARNRQLVRAAEQAIAVLEKRLALHTQVPEIELVVAVRRPPMGWISYSVFVRGLAIVALVLYSVGGVAASYKLAGDTGAPAPSVSSTP